MRIEPSRCFRLGYAERHCLGALCKAIGEGLEGPMRERALIPHCATGIRKNREFQGRIEAEFGLANTCQHLRLTCKQIRFLQPSSAIAPLSSGRSADDSAHACHGLTLADAFALNPYLVEADYAQ
jgi:hypothetical protein